MSPLFVIDAFAERPFTGNPAAVCLLAREADARWMQCLASELNLSETAFVSPHDDSFRLRWFTPKLEVALCGHATLAAAHALWQHAGYDGPIRFRTLSGLLTTTRAGDSIEMDFPAEPCVATDAPPALLEALGLRTPTFVGRNRFDLLIAVEAESLVRELQPDFGRLAAIEARGIIVTSRCHAGRYDFVSRFFAPQSGILEDPVTGSAHCCLGPFWSERLGKRTLVGCQASARGGVVRVQVNDDRVSLGGRAVTVLRGEVDSPSAT